ncbi:DUF2461 domain-containing protein [Nocardioides sp. HDW12B]|uniref:DUF2461 domain-containing protein n=1 Tax=Nocardioides sp. HDW12B TaxID=2714939 RepID=UPI001F0EC0D9|nr:DUF2461 domain-containing protein [Nocardioides sp. HDW12B]
MSAEVPAFAGFPVAALDFYDDLELDNTKSFWAAHKHVWEESVRDPMLALTAALAPEFGQAKVFRPYRDVRFAKDKTPYKDHQGAFVETGPSTGLYVQVGAPGVFVGAGYYHPESERLAALRRAVADDRTGEDLERILAALERRGWVRGGERLKTVPRGFDADHPRIDLLRHKTLTLRRDYGFEPFVHTSALLDAIRKDWRAARPFLTWVEHAAG